ncbi:MAG: GNAT family N-acetyltransferase [Pseudomonadota bacterium]
MLTPLIKASQIPDYLLATDLEYKNLLRDPKLAQHHLAREKHRVDQVLASGGWGFVSDHGSTLVRPLPWDSAHFGVPCADLTRLYLVPAIPEGALFELLQATVQEADKRKLTMLSARVLAYHHRALQVLASHSFSLVDTSVELGCTDLLQREGSNATVREGKPSDCDGLCTVAMTFVNNRFYRDPHIPNDKANGVYTSWVTKALAGKHGNLMVVETGGQVAGVCTYIPSEPDGLNVGIIGLIVIGPEFRNKGLSAPLVTACANQMNCVAVVTSTQEDNIASLRAFGNLGLMPINTRCILHRWSH